LHCTALDNGIALVGADLKGPAFGGIVDQAAGCGDLDFGQCDSAIEGGFDDLRGVEPAVFLRGDDRLAVGKTDFYFCDAIQASEVLLHPIGSKVSSHALNAELHALHLREERGRTEQQKKSGESELASVHNFSFLRAAS